MSAPRCDDCGRQLFRRGKKWAEHPVKFHHRLAIQYSDLPHTARHTGLNLNAHMSEDGGSCFPSILRQSRETGLGESTVKRDIEKHIIPAGLLERDRDGVGRGHVYRYQALIPEDLMERVRADALPHRRPTRERGHAVARSASTGKGSRPARKGSRPAGKGSQGGQEVSSEGVRRAGYGKSPDDNQRYLLSRLVETSDAWGQVTPERLLRLNQTHDRPVVTTALQRLREENATVTTSAYSLLSSVCEDVAKTTTEGAI